LPLYEYKCRTCQTVTEVRHGFREVHDGVCPACGGELARVFHPAGIVFKGSGFYINDSRAASKKSTGGASADAGAKPDAPSVTPDAGAAKSDAPAASSTPTPPSTGGDSGPKKSETAA